MRFLANQLQANSFAPIALEAGGSVGAARPDELADAMRRARHLRAGSTVVEQCVRRALIAEIMANGPPRLDGGTLALKPLTGGLPRHDGVPVWLEFPTPKPDEMESDLHFGPAVGCLFVPGEAADDWSCRVVAVVAPTRERAFCLPAEIRLDADGQDRPVDAETHLAWELLPTLGHLVYRAAAVLSAVAAGACQLGDAPSFARENSDRLRRGKPPLLAPAEVLPSDKADFLDS